jgi:hypothetical protein
LLISPQTLPLVFLSVNLTRKAVSLGARGEVLAPVAPLVDPVGEREADLANSDDAENGPEPSAEFVHDETS